MSNLDEKIENLFKGEAPMNTEINGASLQSILKEINSTDYIAVKNIAKIVFVEEMKKLRDAK